MIKLAPSILSADFSALGQDIRMLDASQADYIHIDIMDGHFVPNLSFGLPVLNSIRKHSTKTFDVHLMIDEPSRYLKEFAAAGADLLTVHCEACRHLHRTVAAIKELGLKAGVALNPATPLTSIEYVLEDVDMVLLMTVNPGFGGASYIHNVTPKIKKLRTLIADRNLDTDIEVDGGIRTDNVQTVINAGANIIVAGSSVFRGDPISNIGDFYNIFKEAANE